MRNPSWKTPIYTIHQYNKCYTQMCTFSVIICTRRVTHCNKIVSRSHSNIFAKKSVKTTAASCNHKTHTDTTLNIVRQNNKTIVLNTVAAMIFSTLLDLLLFSNHKVHIHSRNCNRPPATSCCCCCCSSSYYYCYWVPLTGPLFQN